MENEPQEAREQSRYLVVTLTRYPVVYTSRFIHQLLIKPIQFQGTHWKSDKLLFKMDFCSFWGQEFLGRGCNILKINVTFFVTTLHPHPVWVHPSATFAVSDIGLGGSDHHRFGPPKKNGAERGWLEESEGI